MGWQRRDSGNLYNLLYDNAFMIGFHTGKVLYDIVVANKCASCVSLAQLKNEPKVNSFPWTYEGITKAIESESSLVLAKCAFYKKGFLVESSVPYDN